MTEPANEPNGELTIHIHCSACNQTPWCLFDQRTGEWFYTPHRLQQQLPFSAQATHWMNTDARHS